jgi:topoisomerase-4 subunit A
LKAKWKGKIKIKTATNTAAEVEILIHLFPGVSPENQMLVCFTACETSVAPLGCKTDNKPLFIGFLEMLRISTAREH